MKKNNGKNLLREFIIELFNKLFTWVKGLPTLSKILFFIGVLLLMICILGVSSYVGFFGEGVQKYLNGKIEDHNRKMIETTKSREKQEFLNNQDSIRKYNIIKETETVHTNISAQKSKISRTDINDTGVSRENKIVIPRIRIQFEFSVNGHKGINGEEYYENDNLELFLCTDQRCYVSLFCINNQGIFCINKDFTTCNPEVILPSENSKLIAKLLLDNNKGVEVFYAIASHSYFNFDLEIRPIINKMVDLLNKYKGVKRSPFLLNLPKGYYQDHIYFYHKTKNDRL